MWKLTIQMLVLLSLTRCQAWYNYGVHHQSHVSQLKNEGSAVFTPNHQTGGSSADHRRPVVVKCHPESWEVIVQADLFNTGLMVDSRYLRLGVEQRRDPSSCRAVPSGPTEYTIQARLMDCGTVKLPPTEEKIIYSNVLVYSPEPSSDGLLRLDGATIPVHCYYDKFYSVQTITLLPTWAPFVLRTTVDSQIDFNMRLMTEDWQFQRESHKYYVGDPLHFEVSSILSNHKPLRVFVNHCVATATPDPEAALRYDFIDHNGCLADAPLTNSSAHFLLRTDDHRIQFQLDAFTFYQENANQIYITCHLTAVSSMITVKSKHRACSLIDTRWRSADGDDEDCISCAVPYRLEESPAKAPSTERIAIKSVQPVPSRGLGRNTVPQQPPATYMPVQSRQNVHAVPQSSAGFMRKGTVKLGPLRILRTQRASDSTSRGRLTLGIAPL